MGLLLQYLLIGAFSWFIVYVLTANVDHNVFLKQIHLQELEIQIQHMHEKLYEHCPNGFRTPNSASIIGRRRSVDTSLDLKIELAEKTLEYVILAFDNCTSTFTVMTLRISTETRMPTTSTESILRPTSALVQATTTYSTYTTTNRYEHAFQVLRSKNVTYKGYEFMALEVRVPADGLSKSSNWCYDYQYLCKDFHRRPTGCGITYISDTYHNYCRVKYNSDMNIGNSLGCNPSNNIADLANIAFPNMSRPAHYSNAFGFYQCWSCNKTIRASRLALAYMEDFWQSNMTTFYTVCR